jgi:hypothetical protein
LNGWFSEEEMQMANKHMKKCSAPLAIKEMHFETTLRFHFTHQNGHHKQTNKNKYWLGCGGNKGTLIPRWWECKLVQPLRKSVRRFLKKQKIGLPHDLAIPFSVYTQSVNQYRREIFGYLCVLLLCSQ